jgi:O-antigen/teichoic acid export membrane protein
VINGVDRPDIAFRINAVFIAVNVGLNVLLVWQYGWFGAAVATILSSAVILVLSYRAVNELIGSPRFPLVGISRQIAASTVMALAVIAVDRALPIQNMYVTVALVGFGAAVYGCVLYAMSGRLRTKVHSLVVT